MKVVGRRHGNVVVIALESPVEIEASNVEHFREAVEAERGNAPHVVLDAASVPFLDSAGLGSLLTIQKRCVGVGGQLVVAGAGRAVQEVFRMVGFDLLLRCYPDVPSALAALGVREG